MNDKRERSAKKPAQANNRKPAQRTASARPQQPLGERPTVGINGTHPRSGMNGAPNAPRSSDRNMGKKRVPPAAANKANSGKKAPPKRQARQAKGRPVPSEADRRHSGAVPRKQTRGGSAKRHRYHGGNYTLYYMLAGVVIITILAILANTVLFKCKQIVVSGNARYSAEEIAAASGIELGNNLLHINAKRAGESIVAGLPYVDGAQVKKSFPTGIDITVEEAEKWYCIREGGTTAAVSRRGKIVEHSAADGLTVFTGCEPKSLAVGEWFSSETDGKDDIPSAILKAIETAGLDGADEVDITDRFSMKMYVDGGRVILELGTVSDMESKLVVAKTLIASEIGPSEKVTILLSNPIQPTVRRNYDESEPEQNNSASADEPGDNSGDVGGTSSDDR